MHPESILDILVPQEKHDPRTPNELMAAQYPGIAKICFFAFLEAVGTEEGSPIEVGDLDLNFFASLPGRLGNPSQPTVHVQGHFFRYKSDKGIYQPLHPDTLLAEWSLLIDRCAQFFGDRVKVQSFQRLKEDRVLCRVLNRSRHLLSEEDDFFQDGWDRYLPLENGVLDLRTKTLLPFSPDLPFKYTLPVRYEPDAKPDNFLTLLSHVLSPQDLELLQCYLGMLLLPKNYPQRILIISGDAGWGKGMILRLVESILGSNKVGVLREQLFTDKYELARHQEKRVLVHPDLPTEWLHRPQASTLKLLVGGDLMSADRKGQPDPIQMHGDFGVILCCNSTPRIKIDHDHDAWKRRLAVIEVKEPRQGRRIGKLSEILGAVEQSAILNWMLEGREKVVRGGYQIHLSALQQERVMRLLSESNSHVQFVQDRLEADEAGQVTIEEVRKAYIEFCREWSFRPVDPFGFTKLMDGVIMNEFGAHHRHDIEGADGKARRGWKRIRLHPPPESKPVSLSE